LLQKFLLIFFLATNRLALCGFSEWEAGEVGRRLADASNMGGKDVSVDEVRRAVAA